MDQATAVVGRVMSFGAQGLEPGEQVSVTLDDGVVAVGPLVAGNHGEVAGLVELPSDLRTGTHVLRLTGASSGTEIETEVTVTRDPAEVSAAEETEDAAGAAGGAAAGAAGTWRPEEIAVGVAALLLLVVILSSLVTALKRRADRRRAEREAAAPSGQRSRTARNRTAKNRTARNRTARNRTAGNPSPPDHCIRRRRTRRAGRPGRAGGAGMSRTTNRLPWAAGVVLAVLLAATTTATASASAAADDDQGPLLLTVTVPEDQEEPPGEADDGKLTDAELRWAVSTQAGSESHLAGQCNFLVADRPGTNGNTGGGRLWTDADRDLYHGRSGDVRVVRTVASGRGHARRTERTATFGTRCTSPDGRPCRTARGARLAPRWY